MKNFLPLLCSTSLFNGLTPEELQTLLAQLGSVMRSYGKGDQYVTVIVETPKNLTDEQRQLFEKLADSLERFDGQSAKGARRTEKKKEDKGFFDKMKDLFTDDDEDDNN